MSTASAQTWSSLADRRLRGAMAEVTGPLFHYRRPRIAATPQRARQALPRMRQDKAMSVLRALARTLGVSLRAGALLTAGGIRGTRYLGRGALAVRRRGGAGEAGMLRLFDLHAASCAGGTLVAI